MGSDQSDTRHDSERTIGDIRVRIVRRGQPRGWVFTSMHDVNGAILFQGLVTEDDLAIELVDHLDRWKNYERARHAAS